MPIARSRERQPTRIRGSTLPENQAGLSNTFGLFNGALTFNTLFDYRGKFWNSYRSGSNRAVSAATRRK